MYEVCIVGGGVAGLSAAIRLAEVCTDVILIEKNTKLGKKIYATGNGKCNITNTNMELSIRYNSSYDRYETFIRTVMGDTPCDSVRAFMNSIGIATVDKGGYIYPYSLQASAVAWAMIDKVKKSNINIKTGIECLEINKNDNGFELVTDAGVFLAKKVIIACGGKSYPSLGGSEKGYKLAAALGDNIIPVRPALCGVITDNIPKELSGVRLPAVASLYNEEGIMLAAEKGELQITDYGLSGIMIFNLSSLAGCELMKNKKTCISLNFIFDLSDKNLRVIYENSLERTITGFLNGFLNDKLATYILKRLNIDGKTMVSEIDNKDMDNIIKLLSDLRFEIKDIKSFEQAQVCAGGVDLSDINPDKCESKNTDKLYYAGEIMDVDGVCGGYNITYAILSGIKAGEACIYDKN